MTKKEERKNSPIHLSLSLTQYFLPLSFQFSHLPSLHPSCQISFSDMRNFSQFLHPLKPDLTFSVHQLVPGATFQICIQDCSLSKLPSGLS